MTVTRAAFSEICPYERRLTLSRDIAPRETVTVSYRCPAGESGLWDVDGQQLADSEDRPVVSAAALTAAFHDFPWTSRPHYSVYADRCKVFVLAGRNIMLNASILPCWSRGATPGRP